MTIKFKQNLGKKEIIENLSSVIGFSSKNIQKITEEIIEIIIALKKPAVLPKFFLSLSGIVMIFS